jgi:hypothetical protein
MKTVTGILSSRSAAEHAVKLLRGIGISADRINLLTPDASHSELAEVPTTETEQPGMGAAMGGVVGGALGAAGGMSLGAAVATLLVPGVGAVLAIGLAGAALLGAGGAVGGAAAGKALEDSMARGLPIDELFVYEHALRQGRSVVIAFVVDEAQADQATAIMREAGAESVDAARKDWWVGLRDDERADYSKDYEDFQSQEASYRQGFEAAMYPAVRGKSYRDAVDYLRKLHPQEHTQDSFRRGYQRGQSHYRGLLADRASAGK